MKLNYNKYNNCIICEELSRRTSQESILCRLQKPMAVLLRDVKWENVQEEGL